MNLLPLFRFIAISMVACLALATDVNAQILSASNGLAGGNISYTHVGGDTFNVTVDYYVDCNSTVTSANTLLIRNCSNTQLGSITLTLNSSSEVSDYCTATDCSSGSVAGVRKYSYSAVFVDTFSGTCFHLTATGDDRNTSQNISYGGGSTADYIYLEADLDLGADGSNNSALFGAVEIPYICTSQVIGFDPQVTDADGDSLVFSLVSVKAGVAGSSTVSYGGSLSGSEPISGITIDPVTGVLQFTAPSSAGNYAVVIQVNEYDPSSGTLVGMTFRDFQFRVQNCSNAGPVIANSLSNVTNATLDGNYEVTIDTGNAACFSLVFTGDAGETVTVDTSNLEAVIPGANASINTSSNVTTVEICWTPAGSDFGTYMFSLSGEDDACPINGMSAQTITVNVEIPQPFTLDSIVAIDETCAGANDGQIYIYTSGGVGPFSYTIDPFFGGAAITQDSGHFVGLDPDFYQNITMGDSGTSTAINYGSTVIVSPSSFQMNSPRFSNVVAVSCDDACDGDARVNVTGGATPYVYSWSNGETTQTASSLCGGTNFVTVTDDEGCTLTDSITIVEPPVVYAEVDSTDSVTCNGGSDGEAYISGHGGFATSSSTAAYIVDQTQGSFEPYGFGSTFNTTNYTTLSLGDDAMSTAQNIGFNFEFFGNTYTQFRVSSNGFITFNSSSGANGCCSGDVLPDSDAPNDLIAGYWEDLDPNGGADGTIEYYTVGSSPRRALVVNFVEVPHFPGTANFVTFQIVLYESSNVIQIFGIDCPSDGQTHSQGIENSTGTAAHFVTGRSAANFSLTNDYVAFIPESQSFNYSWSSIGSGASSTSLVAGNYTVTVTDPTASQGCNDVVTFSIEEPDAVTISTTSTEPTCNGDADGSIAATASGGNGGPYTYSWNTGGTSATITGLAASTYTVTATDNSGCTAVETIVLGEPTVVSVSLTPTNVSCNGGADGSIVAAGSGGTGGITYAWSNSGTGTTITGLVVGTYTVTATDGNGCTATASATLTEPATAVSVTASSTAESCSGAANGTATASGSGGTGTITYAWSNSGSGVTINGLVAGTYTVTATDANGCTATAATTVTAGGSTVSVNIASSTNVNCNGGNDGAATAGNASGGTSPYTYAWSNSGSGQNITGLTADTYTVTATDNNGCEGTASVVITEPAVALSLTITVDSNASCNGSSDGGMCVVASGGTPGYAYSWSDGSTGPCPTGLPAGNYTVTVTDANGCTATLSESITEPTTMFVSIATTQPSCSGGTGSATASGSGGTPGYTYAWSNSATGATITGLAAGTYTVTATDANGCTATASTTISNAAAITVTATPTDVNCNGGSDGSVAANASGGTGTFTYAWSNSGAGATITGLVAGTYTVTATDGNGCTGTASATVGQPASAVSTTVATTDADCNGAATGTASAVPTGGTPGYTYSWSDSSTDSINTGLTAGTYTVTVTDANGCAATASGTVDEPAVVIVSTSVSATPSCATSADGSVQAFGFGGTGPYTYGWSTGGTGSTITGLTAGTYTVTITDNNGCTDTEDEILSAPNPLVLTADFDSTSCNGTTDGTAWVDVSGGSMPYSFSWSTSSTNDTIFNQPAGTYTVTVTDNNGCTEVATVNIVNGTGATVAVTGVDPDCAGDATGTATATATGTGTITYAWSNSGTGATITGLVANTYTVTVTDANGCTATASVTLTDPAALSLSLNGTDPTCNGSSDGQVAATASGGTGTLTYAWSNSGSGATITGLPSGPYTVTVSDANGCTITASTTLNDPTGISLSTNVTNVLCNGDATGSITVTPSGGATPYIYAWSNSGSTATISGLPAGTYTVTVTDNSGCTATTSATVSQPATAVAVSVNSTTDPTCVGDANGQITVGASGGTGTLTYAWSNGGSTTATNSGLTAGTYTVTVTDANGCMITASATLNQGATVTASAAATQASLCSLCTGQAQATGSGGQTPYTYAWSNSGNTATITSLCSGPYTVTVSDNNGCTATSSAVVNDVFAPSPNASAQDASCFTSCDGELYSNYTCGACDPLEWFVFPDTTSLVGTGDTLTGICQGTYLARIRTSFGCTRFDTVVVGSPTDLTTTITSTDASCSGGATGSATASASGGTPGYSYSWSNSGSGATITGLTAGTYTVTVTDNNGCMDTVDVVISAPSTLTVSIGSASGVSCFGENDGGATATPSGGIAPYTYLWDSGETGATASLLSGGSQCVTVTDDSNCTATMCVTIPEPSAITLTPSGTDPSCNGDSDGTASVSASGGTPGYTYAWSNSGSGSTITGLVANTYTVTVTDANGCTETTTVTLTDPALVSVSTTTTDVNCNGGSDGTATASGSGGSGTFSYAWSNSGSGVTITGLTAGTYTVTATDGSGCTATATATVGEPASSVVANIDSTANNDCFGAADGFALASGSGGTPGYSFEWSNGSLINSASNLTAGTYTVTVTDNNGCTATTTATITQPASGMTASIASSTNVTCNGGADGAATATTSGATGSVTYAWSNSGSGATITGLTADTYTVTATDASGCTATAEATITEPTAISLSMSGTDPSCGGAADGTASVAATGGTPGYTYAWSNSGSGTSITGLTADTYTVTVTDANGCTATDVVILTDPTGVSVTTSTTSTNCNGGSDGTATASATGGSGTFSYAWSNSGSGVTITGLTAGTYTVTATDGNGCTGTATATVTEPATSVIASIDSTANNDCFGAADGFALASGSGGTPGYSFEWSNGSLINSASNLTAGTYTVTVTDNNGCTATTTATITQPATGMTASIASSTNVTCNGGADGDATATTSGATGTVTYAWSNSGSGASITGLTAGTYTVTATDASGCTATAEATISEPTAITVSIVDVDDITCNGGADGCITAMGSGGTGTLSYSWSSGCNTAQCCGLVAGTYTVTVTDANGCTATLSTDTLMQTEPAALSAAFTGVQSSSCTSCTGQATANVSGGTPGYTYAWPNSQTGMSATLLCQGSNILTVTDANGCVETFAVIIASDNPDSISAQGIDPTCAASCDGIVYAQDTCLSGCSYVWTDSASGSVVGNTDTVSALCGGTYIVQLTNASGCISTDTVTITDPAGINVVITGTIDVSCLGGNDGSATANASGGSGTYSYVWPGSISGATATGLTAGTYTVTATDANGCTGTAEATIDQPATGLTVTASVDQDVSCNGGNDGAASAVASGGTGTITYTWNGSLNGSAITGLTAGTYTVVVSDAGSCTATDQITIAEPTVLTGVIDSFSDPSCPGLFDGNATVSGSGGTPGYTYLWTSGNTSQTETGLGDGVHCVTITDANLCSVEVCVTITDPASISNTFTGVTSTSGCGVCDAAATANPFGGNGSPFTYAWSTNGQITATNDSLCAGTNTVTITDSAGCTFVDVILINATGADTVYADSIDATCGNCDGIAYATYVCNDGPCLVSWTALGNSTVLGTTDTLDSLCAGQYIVELTNNSGCVSVDMVTVNAPDLIDPNATVTDASCPGVCDGMISLAPTGGSGTFTYNWSNSATTATVTGLCGGTSYTVTISDGATCDTVVSFFIDEPASIAPNGIPTDVSCFGLCDGTVALNPSGGGGSYTYNWSPVPGNGQGVQAATGLCAGTYFVTVSDVNGCEALDTFNISEPSQIVQSATAVTDASCGECDGEITQTISGGAGGFTYLWSNADTAASVDSLCFGFYDVTVTDANGCTEAFGYPVSETGGPSISLSGVNASASGQCDGSATATVTASLGNVTFAWSNGDTTSMADSLCAGTFVVTATDSNGCSTVDTITITEPDQLSLSFTVTDITCTGGGCDGEVMVSVNGGVAPFTYLWNTSDTTSMIDSLCAGTYTVTVVDDNGSIISDSVTLEDPSPFTITSTVNNTSCPGSCDGSIFLNITGGTTAPIIVWSTGDTVNFIDSLCAGMYSVTVSDSQGCSDSIMFTITSPPDLDAPLQSMSNPDCQLSNGSISVTGTGGNGGPYSYLWLDATLDTLMPMQTTGTASGLFAGIYSVVLADINGCLDTFAFVLNNANAPSITLDSIVDVSCFGECDGAVEVTLTGGTMPYTVQWSSGGTMEDDSNLCAGPDTIAVADANLCLSFDIFTVEQPGELGLRTMTATAVTCGSDCDGELTASISGGTEPYTYAWSNGGSDSVITGLCAGMYNLTVTDANGCSFITAGTVDGPSPLVVTLDSTNDATCTYTGDGNAFITVSGGTPPYSYAWTDGTINLSGQDLSNVLAGTYTLTVTSSIGCTAVDTFTIGTEYFVDVTAMEDVDVCPLTNGIALTATDSGSTSVRWLSEEGVVLSNGNSVSVNSVQDTNIFIFEGINGVCISRDTVLVLEYDGPGIDAGPDRTIEPGASITIGGSPTANSSVDVTWTPNIDITGFATFNPTVFPLQTRVYYVSGTDGDGCYGVDSVVVTVEKIVDPVGGFSPNGDGINDDFYIDKIANYPNAVVQIFNRWGNLIYESDPGYTNPWNGKYQGKQLTVGTYYYVIDLKDANVSKLVTGPVTILK